MLSDIGLAVGAWEARLRPAIGGCLSALAHDGQPVLRNMPDGADHPLQSACFPLVPYCNRIANGHLRFGDREVTLTANLPPQPHPLHGLGWLREWRVVRNSGASALLEDDYAGDGEWPWPYRAHQHVALDESGCTIRLLVENRSEEAAPMGLGLHPYFRRAADSRVRFSAREMLGIDGEFLPDGTSSPADKLAPWGAEAALPDCLVDNCFTGWGGSATITDGLGTITMHGFGAPNCHVFTPPRGEELCVEPVNHVPDALNRAAGSMPIVLPGCTAAVALRIEASSK